MKRRTIRVLALLYLLLFSMGVSLLGEQELTFAADTARLPASVRIHADGRTIEQLTYKKTLLEAIDEADIALGETCQISLPEDTPLQPGKQYEVSINRFNKVTLSWSGYSVGTTGDFSSWSELFSRSGFSNLDLSNGSRIENNTMAGSQNTGIYLGYVRVEKRTVRLYETIPFSTIVVDDATLYTGQSVIKVKGQDGQRALIFEETYENGIFIQSEQTGSEIVKQPVQQVVRKGTKQRFVFAPIYRKTLKQTVLNGLSKIKDQIVANGSKSYQTFQDNGNGSITVDGQVYAFTSMKKRTIVMYDGLEVCLQNGCHDPPINHNTFSGVPAQRGIVAVAGKRVDGKFVGTALPMGTIVFVEGYGLGVVGDVNGAKTNLDLIDACYDPGEIRAGIATLGKIYSRVYILKIP